MDVKDIVKARMDSTTPQGDVNIPEQTKADMRRRVNAGRIGE